MKIIKRILWSLAVVLVIGLVIPQNLKMPVQGATATDYNPDSFWFYPWGKSVTHKGVDIFAKKGTHVHSAVRGVVLYSGSIKTGGKVVLILGPKWRLHYYAHLDQITTAPYGFVSQNTQIGTVGNSGNAIGKPAHLHYSIFTLLPYPWRIDSSPQGWKKMWYLNPIAYIK